MDGCRLQGRTLATVFLYFSFRCQLGLYFFRETTQYNAEETIKGTGQLKLKR